MTGLLKNTVFTSDCMVLHTDFPFSFGSKHTYKI